MPQFNNKRTHDIPIRYLPSLRTSVTLIWLEDTSSLSREVVEIADNLCASNNCHIFRYTNVSKCLKYLKEAKSYERIIIIIIIDNLSITTTDISRLCQYRLIQSIFTLSSIADRDKDINRDLSGNIRDEIGKISEVFHDYQSLFDRLQQLVNEIDEFDDNFFTFFYRSEKTFRHLSTELGSYIWSQSLRGKFA
jgi:methyl-accepting chemotaxis protein